MAKRIRTLLGPTVDLDFQALGVAGHTGSFNDRMFKYLGGIGFTGNLTDRLVGFHRDPRDGQTANGFAPNILFDFVNGIYRGDNPSLLADTDFMAHARASAGTFTPSTGLTQTAASGVVRDGNHVFDGSVFVNQGRLSEPPARTNLLPRSAELDNPAWTKTNISVTANDAVAPDGNTVADKLSPDITGVVSISDTGAPISAAAVMTASVFFAKDEVDHAYIQVNGKTGGALVASFVTVNLTTGVVGTVMTLAGGGLVSPTAVVEQVDASYFRLSLTGGIGALNTEAEMFTGPCDTQDSRTVTANGADGIHGWGAQIEVGSVPTSYIATAGSQVTRALETLEITEAAWDREILAATGSSSMPAEMSGSHQTLTSYVDEGTAGQMTLFDWRVDVNNRITLTIDTDGAKTGTFKLTMVNAASSATISATAELTPGLNKNFKVAWRVTASEINIALDGVAETATVTAIGVPDLTTVAADLVSTGDVYNKAKDRFWFTNIEDAGLSEATS